MRCSCFLLDFPVSKRNIFFSFLLLTRCNKLLSGVTRVMTACIAFQLLVASLQLHKWKLITVSSFAENFGSGFKKRKKKLRPTSFYTPVKWKMSIEQGGRLGAQNKMKLFLETFFDISFFPHLTKYNSNMNLARKFKYLNRKETNESYAKKILMFLCWFSARKFKYFVMLQTETFWVTFWTKNTVKQIFL